MYKKYIGTETYRSKSLCVYMHNDMCVYVRACVSLYESSLYLYMCVRLCVRMNIEISRKKHTPKSCNTVAVYGRVSLLVVYGEYL